MEDPRLKFHVSEHHKSLSDQEWTEMLVKSIGSPIHDRVIFPDFPPPSMQAQFVGSSNEAALREAGHFYSYVKRRCVELDASFTQSSKLLDFGCGWGRFLRFFWRDLSPGSLFGVDIDPNVISMTRKSGLQAELARIDPMGNLPYDSASLSHVIAYSVFTHLPENIHLHWMKEIARVAKPGCLVFFTVEPRRFLDFVAAIPPKPDSDWHFGLRRAAGDLETAYKKFDADQLVYIPTGGGEFRESEIYGDAVVSENYLKTSWSDFFEIVSYLDEPTRFWQAVVCARRL